MIIIKKSPRFISKITERSGIHIQICQIRGRRINIIIASRKGGQTRQNRNGNRMKIDRKGDRTKIDRKRDQMKIGRKGDQTKRRRKRSENRTRLSSAPMEVTANGGAMRAGTKSERTKVDGSRGQTRANGKSMKINRKVTSIL